MSITLTQLRSFLAVVRNGSVTGAAEELVVTQPSVSAALSALSQEVGAGLTERVGRNLRLTAAGEAFAPYATESIGLLSQGRRAAQEAVAAADRELRIAAVTTAGEYIVPPLMQAFGAEHPDIHLTVDVGNRRRVFQRVVDRAADVAIGGRPPPDNGLVGVPFLENEIVLIASPADPLVARRRVPIADLEDRVWLLREEDSGTRTMTEQFLAGHGLGPEVLTLGSNGAIKHAVRAGLGVSLQSRLAVELELESGLLSTIRLAEPMPARHWYVMRAATGPTRPTIEAFMAFAEHPEARAAVESARDAERHAARGARRGR